MAICDIRTDTERVVDFLGPSHSASHSQNNQEDLCDNLFESPVGNIETCRYFDNNFQINNLDNALMLMHINVRSLHKNFDLFHEFIS